MNYALLALQIYAVLFLAFFVYENTKRPPKSPAPIITIGQNSLWIALALTGLVCVVSTVLLK